MELQARTLNSALEAWAADTPEKIFMYHRSASYTYERTALLVDRFSAFLQSRGVQAGGTVCLMLPRTPELILAFLSATKIGAIPCPVNYLSTPGDIVGFIKEASPSVMVASTEIVPDAVLQELRQAAEILCVDTDNSEDDWVTWSSTISHHLRADCPPLSISDLAYYNFTTGSSGKPKGALTTHENIYWNTRSMVEMFALSENDVHLCMFAAFAHPHEIFARALYTGASIVLLQEINPRTIIQTINRYSVTCIMGLAVMYEALVNHCASMSAESLRMVESGGMYTRQDLNERFQAAFGLPIFSVWGSTETNGVAIANTFDEFQSNGSMGKVCPFYEIRLLSDGREVGTGEVGELFIKGPGISSRYNGYPSLTDDDGWYASGDLATKDENGFYHFVERKSGMVKMAGLKVYPLQIELSLIKHPGIKEIAVLGVADDRKGAVPKAFVVREENVPLNSDDLRLFCKGRIPNYMIPKEFEFLEELPKIGSGKIDKKAIAAMN